MEQDLLSLLTADIALLPATRPESGSIAGSGENVILFSDLLSDEVGNLDTSATDGSLPLADLLAQAPLASVPQILQDAGYEIPAELTEALSGDGKASPLPGKTLPNDLLEVIRLRLAGLAPGPDEVARSPANSISDFASIRASVAPDRGWHLDNIHRSRLVGTDRDLPDPVTAPTENADIADDAVLGSPTARQQNLASDRDAQALPEVRSGFDRAVGAGRQEPSNRFDRTFSELAKVLIPAGDTQAVPEKNDDSFFDFLRRDFETSFRADANSSGVTNASNATATAATPGIVFTAGDTPAAATATRPMRGDLFLNPDLANPQWPAALAERVTFAVNEKFQQADLRLNPPQLGQIELRISLVQDQASVSFSSQHVAVRDAIEAALPRLREALADAGLNLVNVDVSDRSLAQDRRHSYPEQDRPRATQHFADYGISAEAPSVFGLPEGRRIDYFV